MVGAAAGVVLLMLFRRFPAAFRKTVGPPSSRVLPSGVVVTPAPLLTEADVLFYNLMRMAVQDRYLVFVQVPLWSFVSVEAVGEARSHVLSHMALKRVDIVLVHPGSRQVEQVVLIEDAVSPTHRTERQRVIESVLDAAGIKLVSVSSTKSYTVPDLAALLGLEAEE